MIRLRTLLIGFALFPIIELVAFSLVSGEIGTVRALLLMAGTSLLGVFLLKRSWLVLLRAAQANRVIHLTGPEARDSLLFALGALLLAIPGFASDVLGLICLLPSLKHILAGRSLVSPSGSHPGMRGRRDMIDLDRTEWIEHRKEPEERR